MTETKRAAEPLDAILATVIFRFNVGGTRFETSKTTLAQCPDSLLYKYATTPVGEALRTSDGCLFIDRDATHFNTVLNYHRMGNSPAFLEGLSHSTSSLQRLKAEAEFYMLTDLADILQNLLAAIAAKDAKRSTKKDITRKKIDHLHSDISACAVQVARATGIAIEGRDMADVMLRDHCRRWLGEPKGGAEVERVRKAGVDTGSNLVATIHAMEGTWRALTAPVSAAPKAAAIVAPKAPARAVGAGAAAPKAAGAGAGAVRKES